jgi:hypothetical protein
MEETWDIKCSRSISEESREVEKRYKIKIGQTEIYCARCGKSWGFGDHVCQDIRFKKLKEEKEKRILELKELKNKAWNVLKAFGPQKTSIYLMLPVGTVNSWINRGNIPSRHIEKVANLEKMRIPIPDVQK